MRRVEGWRAPLWALAWARREAPPPHRPRVRPQGTRTATRRARSDREPRRPHSLSLLGVVAGPVDSAVRRPRPPPPPPPVLTSLRALSPPTAPRALSSLAPPHSQASLLSKEVRHTPKACSAVRGHRQSIVKASRPTLPNWRRTGASGSWGGPPSDSPSLGAGRSAAPGRGAAASRAWAPPARPPAAAPWAAASPSMSWRFCRGRRRRLSGRGVDGVDGIDGTDGRTDGRTARLDARQRDSSVKVQNVRADLGGGAQEERRGGGVESGAEAGGGRRRRAKKAGG